jgi:hypothetical protein
LSDVKLRKKLKDRRRQMAEAVAAAAEEVK